MKSGDFQLDLDRLPRMTKLRELSIGKKHLSSFWRPIQTELFVAVPRRELDETLAFTLCDWPVSLSAFRRVNLSDDEFWFCLTSDYVLFCMGYVLWLVLA
jgi:hypothetical protein